MTKFYTPVLKSSLAITTNVGCRNMCSYCPQKIFIQAYKKRSGITKMSFNDFVTAIDSVPRSICLSFSGFSEPWLNADCTKMIVHAHNEGFKIRVNTTIIGMKEDDIRPLKSIPFIKFVVHLPDNQKLTRIKVDETYLTSLTYLLNQSPANLCWKFHKNNAETDIHPEVLEILQKHHAKIQIFGLNSRAGKVDTGTTYTAVNKGKMLKECQDFHHNILLPNGDVALCHMDWSLKHMLGNLLEQNYAQLHSGETFQFIQSALQNTEADLLCRECEKDIVKRSMVQGVIHSIKKKLRGEKSLY